MSQSAMRGPVVVMEAEFEALRYDVDFDWHHECAIALACQSQVLLTLAGPASCGHQSQYMHTLASSGSETSSAAKRAARTASTEFGCRTHALSNLGMYAPLTLTPIDATSTPRVLSAPSVTLCALPKAKSFRIGMSTPGNIAAVMRVGGLKSPVAPRLRAMR